MRRYPLLRLDVPYREQIRIEAFEFGDEQAPLTCSIVGQMRGDEVQQAYTCARLVERLKHIEERGGIRADTRILVIPCANPFSMNVASRFWPADGTDINRRFPGNVRGETTERVAAGIFHAVRGSSFGIQLASFNQDGDFLPHVRVTLAGAVSEESLAMAADFRLPSVVSRKPTPFDTGTLNYSWQKAGTHAFSLYTRTTDRIDRPSANLVESAVIRFMTRYAMLGGTATGGVESQNIDESALVDVRTEDASGYLESHVKPGDMVNKGSELAVVRDAFDGHIRESLLAPCAGRVFFCRVKALLQQRMVAFRIAPEG